jgi:hypothetical protein
MSVHLKPQAVPRPAPKQPTEQAVSPIANTIRQAAKATGASFEYLLATAKVESNLKPGLKARTSSATGLFQFIEQTWFGMMKQAGKALGFGRYADAITQTRNGKYQVNDPQVREEILQLRKDAAANATMAGVFTRQNAAALGKRIGRVPSDGELYIAHFFGSGGASKLINAMNANPQGNAAQAFPAAARANHSIFYDKQGQARSLAGVYRELNRRYQVARANTAPHLAPAQVAAAPTPGAPAVPDTAGTTRVFAVAAAERVTPVAENKPVFRSLFHTGDGRAPVSPLVAELWTAPVAQAEPPSPTAAVAAAAAPAEPGAALDLFQEHRPNVRALFDRSA